MTIVKCPTHVEVYRQKARSRDVRELSGRTGTPWVTEYVARRILDELDLAPGAVMIDVGCGDGTLLRMAAAEGARCIGILPTAEEVHRLREALADLAPQVEVRQGVAENTGIESALASHVVCNGVLLLLTAEDVPRALRELSRIGRPGARVFVGEIPAVDEMADRTYGESISGWLWWVLRRQGARAFGQRFAQVTRALVTQEPLIVAPKSLFYMPPEPFVAMASACGLQAVCHRIHESVTAAGEIKPVASRYDYMFRATPSRDDAEPTYAD